MDNASKALVMAGAILIAVMLISLGVYLFRIGDDKGREVGDELTQQSIVTHNSKFERYLTAEGGSTSGSDVNSLIKEINAYNATTNLVGTYGKINPGENTDFSKIYPNMKYTVSAQYYGGDSIYKGCISTVTVTQITDAE